MPKQSHIAAALLQACRDAELVGLLFPRSEVRTTGRLAHPVPTDQALKLYRGDLNKVLTIAQDERTDQSVLTKYASDSRVSVREAVLCNRSTPQETIERLAGWVLSRKDGLSRIVIERLDAEKLTEAVLANVSANDVNWDHRWFHGEAVAKKAASSRELSLLLAAAGLLPVTKHLLVLSQSGACAAGVSELINASPSGARGELVSHVTRESGLLTVELAELIRDSNHLRLAGTDGFTLQELGAAEILLESDSHDVLHLAMIAGAAGDALTRRIARATLNELGVMVNHDVRPGRFTAEQERVMASRFIELGGENAYTGATLAQRILSTFAHQLPEHLLLTMLRVSQRPTTIGWVAGRYHANLPQPGQIRKLIDDPGAALDLGRQSASATKPMAMSERIEALQNALVQAAGTSWHADAVELLDPYLGRQLHNPYWAKLAMPSLMEAFGTNSDAWDTLLSLSASWSDSFTQLIATTRSLCGLHRAEEPVAELFAEQPLPL